MNEDHADVLDRIMARRGCADAGWRIATLDRRGFELVLGGRVERVEFKQTVASAADFRSAFVALARALDD
jgi:putative heme iron utilization protein